jgi:hypothetical protein
MSKKLTFTLEIEGLELHDKQKAEISKALNDTLLHKLGELDRAGSGAQEKAAGGGPLFFSKVLINGGKMLKLLSPQLSTVINEIEKSHQIPLEGGFTVQTLQTM